HRQAAPRGPNGLAVTEAILDCLREASAAAGVEPSETTAAAIAAAGRLDLTEGLVEPTNIPVGEVPLRGPVSNLLETDEIRLHKDVAAGVIGERYHAERNPDDMAYLTISSGIGAGIAVDGSILSGWD